MIAWCRADKGDTVMKKTRKDCFLGLHFDFHAMAGDEVGSVIDIASIEKMLDATMPDMIQVDSKGHPGISSYMTKAGVHAERMHMDVLRTWRELTASRGIRLYAHHSGLYEEKQAALHPDWASLNADGVPYGGYVSAFSPYVDEVLLPQLREIAGEYGVDGAWIDGDEWAAFVDYSPYARAAWKEKTGSDTPPRPDEEGYPDYAEFCREGFRRYVEHYVTVIKSEFPDFEITSNWMYTHTMPERRSVPIDFISGDYNCGNSVNDARVAARCILPQGLTWDLMAWGQNARPLSWQTRNRCTKEPAQLCQEAAVVLALGGGFQFFNILYGTGGLVQRWAIPGWQQVAEFCRAREPYCFHAEDASDVAVLYPAYYRDRPLFTGGAYRALGGFVSMLADAGVSTAVINESDLSALSRYRVLLLPAAERLEEETVEALKSFVANGGILLSDGGNTLPVQLCGARFAEGVTRLVFPDCGEGLTALETKFFAPMPEGATPIAYCYRENYYREEERDIAATVYPFGRGKVVSLTFALSEVYSDNVTYQLKQFIRNLLRDVGYRAPVEVTGSDYADLTLMKKDGHLMAHIINRAGEHNAVGVRTFREIPPTPPLTVRVRAADRPKGVTRRPEGIPLAPIGEEDGCYLYSIDRLDIHTIVEIDR